MIYRRPMMAVLFALVCIGIANFVSLGDASTSTWVNADERIDFHFQSATVYEGILGVVMGPGEIEGTYDLFGSQSRRESGKFKLIRDDEGYVTNYVLVPPDGLERGWSQERCGFLKDDLGNMWDPGGGSAPIRIYQGLITEFAELIGAQA